MYNIEKIKGKKMKLKASDYRNMFFCGDIHGQLSLLLLSLEKLGYDSDQDVIVTMGDTIDRGEDSLGTALFFLDHKKTKNGKPSAISSRGNHEDFGIDAHVLKNRDWIDSWHSHGGEWSKSHSDEFLENLFTRIDNEFPLYFDIDFKGKHIVASHASVPGYNYALIHNLKNKFLLKTCLVHKPESFPVDEEDEIAVLPVIGADLSIHGHTIVESPYLYKNRLYLETGEVSELGQKTSQNQLTILTLNEETGINISSFKSDSSQKEINVIEVKELDCKLKNELEAILL